jgi:mRNA interferase RelE/StbE
LSAEFRIAETNGFRKKIGKRDYSGIYEKIVAYVYPRLRSNPFFGPNIKKLKGEFDGVYRYRIGAFRLFYTIESRTVMVFVLDIEKSKDSY